MYMNECLRLKAVVNLDNLYSNANEISQLTNGQQLIAVLKADAYGHGIGSVAKFLEGVDAVWGYAVACLDEAMQIRIKDVQKPVLILDRVYDDEMRALVANDIRMTVYDYGMAKKLSNVAIALGKVAAVHIKIDTGMGRIGFTVNEHNADEIKLIDDLPGISVEGVYSHLPRSDEGEEERDYTINQINQLNYMKQMLEDRGVNNLIYHTANSAAVMEYPETHFDMTRPGIILYGLYPSPCVDKSKLKLKPVMSLIAHVLHVRWVEEGCYIGYGCAFKADKRMRIAIVPIGYADGYPRTLCNTGYVLIHGKKAKICGKICMDKIMVDVTDIENVVVEDEALIFGSSEQGEISIEDVASLAGFINYQILCFLGKRIPREYVLNGKVIEQVKLIEQLL